MKASEWIDRFKAKRQIDSDYRAAKVLGLSRNAISNYRNGTPTMDEKTAISLARELGERPEAIVIDQMAERATDPTLRASLREMARGLCMLCLIGSGPRLA